MALRKERVDRKIRSREEIKSVFERGKRVKKEYFDLIFVKNDSSFARFGIIAGRKCGNAVERNYLKRIFREIIFNQKAEYRIPVDFLVVLKSDSKKGIFSKIRDEFNSSIQKIISQFT